MKNIQANLVDIPNRKIQPVTLTVSGNVIEEILPEKSGEGLPYLIPGFIDAHIHIESSMLVPSEFAKLAVVHGTVGTVSDPHEIANVLGEDGVIFMVENAKKVPFYFNFGAPSCVPATNFETAGATIDAKGIAKLLSMPEINYLAEMMNWPGVINNDLEVLKKIEIAHNLGKPVDGHAPGLKGEDAVKYINAGISTDHECFTYEEALHKLEHGMKVIIREGSAARNFEALHPLIDEHYEKMMFCSDDKHPDELVLGHINLLVKRAVMAGHDIFKVLQMACINPVKHYNLKTGLLQKGDVADFILVDNLKEFNVLETWIQGKSVAKNGKTFINSVEVAPVNQFNIKKINAASLKLPAIPNEQKIRVIVPADGELVTSEELLEAKVVENAYVSDTTRDILKLVVVNRYTESDPAIAFIKNFGFKAGAIASSVAHDSHNIIAVGSSDQLITKAVNAVIAQKGGVVAVNEVIEKVLPLPIAGLMSAEDGNKIAQGYAEIDAFAKEMGCQLRAPFMTLSFMALLVIPSLKLSDKGLFDGNRFRFVPLTL